MAKFYYTPFMYTDENERRTWNYYVGKGATFVASTSPSKSDRMTPAELGEVLVRDGLPNRKINIRLLVCYGAGPSPIDSDYTDWQATSGGNSIAKKLVMELATRIRQARGLGPTDEVHPRVAGYQGPTHTGSDLGTLVKPGGARAAEKIKAKNRPVVWPAQWDSENAFEQYTRAVSEAQKSYIIWFDARGVITTKHPTGVAAPVGNNPVGPLGTIGDGDTLLVMAHGFWKNGGAIGPFAGPNMKAMTSKEVERDKRLAGLRDDRKASDLTGAPRKGATPGKKPATI